MTALDRNPPLPRSYREVVVLKPRRVRRTMFQTFRNIVGCALLVMIATPLAVLLMVRS